MELLRSPALDPDVDEVSESLTLLLILTALDHGTPYWALYESVIHEFLFLYGRID